jgi:hypothetical protein
LSAGVLVHMREQAWVLLADSGLDLGHTASVHRCLSLDLKADGRGLLLAGHDGRLRSSLLAGRLFGTVILTFLEDFRLGCFLANSISASRRTALRLSLRLQHSLQCVSRIVARSVRHRVLSDRLVLNDRWNNALRGQALHNLGTSCDLRHRLLLVDEHESRHFSLLAWEADLKHIKYCHAEGEWSQIPVEVLLAEALLFAQTVPMCYQHRQV